MEPKPNPFMRLLRSAKFQVAVLAVLAVLVTRFFGVKDPQVLAAIVGLAGAVIFGIAGEDIATKVGSTAKPTDAPPSDAPKSDG